MGAAASSANAITLLVSSSSSKAQAVLEVARTINEQTLQRSTFLSQREFHVGVVELNALFPTLARDTIENAFAVFDLKNCSAVDSCELFASLILVAPQLSQDAKQKAIFELFNVSTHRRGLMVADEATLLLRTVVVGAEKLLRVVATSTEELPRLAFFEDLTKALYGERETLRYEDFAQLCQASAEINAFMAQWAVNTKQQAT
ncbi:hypothetical protein PF005_g27273 [Phytophthora fragariae]|uniref:EF-hand domain-containing protein n=1 Tax=Phytophthora fragariae TaxID=53985 RepID=A0A6A3QXD0_9STRA|nr:hypothetical protein PF003_g192 [Phytophthora fragariae]KAE8921640.1 hypothetical protein PF009_g28086 [Phytophthora fragariae]KAE8972303.1 hypothetical protein PF011_g25688 [Phytophthora fragariae]KAE9070829.1 hypothetical protein PF007_g26792 [Phytophthora fragariae]KAE9077002.1 hypothetical protein PF010_g23677 [Phytophthora fragariae]